MDDVGPNLGERETKKQGVFVDEEARLCYAETTQAASLRSLTLLS
jgi:hypothetical protein